VPPVSFAHLDLPPAGDSSATVAARVAQARAVQAQRFAAHPKVTVNAGMEGALLDQVAAPDAEGKGMLLKAADRFGLTARGYHRVLRVARTIADLDGDMDIGAPHIAEALSYRLVAAKT